MDSSEILFKSQNVSKSILIPIPKIWDWDSDPNLQ